MSVLTQVRRSVLALASGAGLFRAVGKSQWRQRRLCVLCFHGIALDDEHLWRPGLYLTPDQFGQRMHSLSALDAAVLPLGEALERLRNGTLPPRAVAITFDDGCHDFHQHALPELDAHGFPATVYLTTYYAERDEPVLPLVVDYLLWKANRQQYAGWPMLGLGATAGLAVEANRRALSVRIAAAIRHVAPEVPGIRDLLDEFAAQLGVSVSAIRRSRMISIMTPDQVLDAARRNVSIELHTHRHRTPRNRDLFLRELSDNRSAIRRIVGVDPRHFCYPSGDVDPQMFPWLAEAGVLSATTCQVALAEATSDPFLIPRYLDSSGQSMASFDGWVSGAAAFVSRQNAHPTAPVWAAAATD